MNAGKKVAAQGRPRAAIKLGLMPTYSGFFVFLRSGRPVLVFSETS